MGPQPSALVGRTGPRPSRSLMAMFLTPGSCKSLALPAGSICPCYDPGPGPMRAEIVSIGSELLLGQIVDTNAAFIARHLAGIGLDLFHKVTVGDNLARVGAALTTALERAHVVITTGGLGPTADDVTREAVAQATGCPLVFRPELLADIEAFFRARGFALSPSNRKQAYVPEGAI